MFNKEFPQKIFFEKKLKNLKKDWLRNYFLIFFHYEIIFFKIITIFSISLICGLLFFFLREHFINNWTDNVKANSGVGYGLLKNSNQSIVYLLKIIPVIILFGYFIITNNKFNIVLTFIIGINGLYNIIDKTIVDYFFTSVDVFIPPRHENCVVDYIPFNAFNFNCNVADIFISIGTIFLIINLIYLLGKTMRKKPEDQMEIENEE